MSNGKGDRPRPCNMDRYRANYDAIFGDKLNVTLNVKIGKPIKGQKQRKSPDSRGLIKTIEC